MDMVYMIGVIAVVVLIFLLLTGAIGGKPYRCQRCGFETYSEVEAQGHEKLENSHKVVRE